MKKKKSKKGLRIPVKVLKEFITYLLNDAQNELFDTKYPVGGFENDPAFQLFDKFIKLVTSDNNLTIALFKYGEQCLVNNFYYNGEFVNRKKENLTIKQWKEYCKQNAIIYDNNVCCTYIGYNYK